jgi:hypothetical protein
MHRPIESDQAENESVPEDPAPKREVDLVARRDVLAGRYRGTRKIVPAVAPQATVPPEPPTLTDEFRVLRPDLDRVSTDVNVSVDRAAEQFPTSRVLVGRNPVILPEAGPRFQLLGPTDRLDRTALTAACRFAPDGPRPPGPGSSPLGGR